MFSPKDLVPDYLNHMLSAYMGKLSSSSYCETNRHFNTRVDEHLFWDKNSHFFKHLSTSKGVGISVIFPV